MLGLGTGLVYVNAVDSVIPYANSASVLFDGANQYGEIPDSDLFSPVAANGSGFTISFWVNCVSSAANVRIINKAPLTGATGYEWQVRTDGSSRPKVFFYMGGTAGTKATLRIDTGLSAGTWYHIAFTWNLSSSSSAGLIGYLDGVQKTNGNGATYTSNGTWSAVTNNGSLRMATDGANTFGECEQDEFGIFDDVLSAAQVTAIYNSGSPDDLSGIPYLVGYWRNGDPTGTGAFPTIIDQSSNSNDGTMENMDSSDITTNVP